LQRDVPSNVLRFGLIDTFFVAMLWILNFFYPHKELLKANITGPEGTSVET